MKLIRLAYAAGIVVVSGGCASHRMTAPQQPSAQGLRVSENGTSAQPLYVVDGQVLSAGRAQEIDPDRIAGVEVLKGTRAVERYGDAAANGVVVITTKEGAARGGGQGVAVQGGSARIRVRGNTAISDDVLVLVDGHAVSAASLQDIPTADILDIQVLKGAAAVRQYGDRAAEGVIVVRTKHADDIR